jgi:hypothetical protein
LKLTLETAAVAIAERTRIYPLFEVENAIMAIKGSDLLIHPLSRDLTP